MIELLTASAKVGIAHGLGHDDGVVDLGLVDAEVVEGVVEEGLLGLELRHDVAVEGRLQVEADRLDVGDVVGDEQLGLLELLLAGAGEDVLVGHRGAGLGAPAHAALVGAWEKRSNGTWEGMEEVILTIVDADDVVGEVELAFVRMDGIWLGFPVQEGEYSWI